MRTRILTTVNFIIFKFALLFFVVGVVAAQTSEAATYYVAKTGSNNNSCTQARNQSSAKATIQDGIGCLTAGDTLIVKSGVYSELLNSFVIPIPSGSAGKVITIAANPGDSVTIRPPSNTEDSLSLIHFYDVHYVTVKGFILDARNDVNGTVTVEWPSDHVRIEECEIKNAIFNGVGLFASDNEVVKSNIHTNGFSATYGAGGAWGYGAYVTGGNNVLDGNDVHHNSRYGIHGYSQKGSLSNNIIRNNRVHDNEQEANGAGIMLGGAGNLVYNNIIWNEKGSAIEINYSGPSDIKIYNNTIYQIEGYGIVIGTDSGASNTIVRNNIIVGVGNGAVNNAGSGTIQSNNLTSDPGFVNAPTDFHLKSASSPAVNTGRNLSGVVDMDADGYARGTTPDIGAYEYRASMGALAAPMRFRFIP